MNKKRALIGIFTFLFWYNGYGNNPKIIDTLEIHNQIKSFGINEELLNFKSHFFSSIVFKNDSTIYYNPNSTLHLFEIRLGAVPKVSLISNSFKSGHNFNRQLFIFNDIVYSYGGEGLFNSFPGLIYFDYFSRDWLKQEIKNYPFDSKKVLNSWKIGSKIMVLLHHFSEFGEDDFAQNLKFSFGEIDLERFEYVQNFSFQGSYQELLFQSGLGFFRGNYIYDSDYYSLHGYFQENNTVEYRIFDKSTGSLKRFSKLDAFKPVNGLSYIYIKGSEIYHRDQNGNIESFDVKSDGVIHSKDFLQLYKSKSNNKSQYYLFAGIILTSLFLILIFIKKRKINLSKDSSNNLSQELLAIEKKLNDLRPSIISKEKLDELFGISHYSYETIKTRRSFIIKYVNEKTNLNIDRVRRQDDKRFFDYKIS